MYKLMLIIVVITTITSGCNVQSKNAAPLWEVNPLLYAQSDLNVADDKSFGSRAPAERLLTYDATISIEINAFNDTIIEYFKSTAKKYGGYLSSSTEYRSTIQVTAQNLDAALNDLAVLGKVKSKSVTGNDVTEEYADLGIRLENAQAARKRYLELLAQAENVSAALMVEKELERLNKEIDLLEGQKRYLEQNINFSSITIYLSEKVKPGVLGYIGIGLYEGVKWLFVRN